MLDNITVTEKYILFMIREKKKLYDDNSVIYLVASMIIEMMQNGNLKLILQNKVQLYDKEPTAVFMSRFYQMLYEIGDDGEVILMKLMDNFCFSKNHKMINIVADLIKEGLIENDLIYAEYKKNFFRAKEVLFANENAIDSLKEEIRDAVMDKEVLSDPMHLLISLLDVNNLMDGIFTQEEESQLRSKLIEVRSGKGKRRVKRNTGNAEHTSHTIMGIPSIVTDSTLNIDIK